MPPAHAELTSFIDPDRLYTHAGFIKASGIAATRLYHARKSGIELPVLRVGRRQFVRGADGISFIERLAASEPTDLSAN